ncbi:XdhC family protein [Dethiothermospora halolimnae]|uniref:XdhC family protein n=1 Tax=Dethiothermospora halolimnae TaxID=3114390 RepID=UPI003CCB87BD
MFKNTYDNLMNKLTEGKKTVLLTHLKCENDKKGSIIKKELMTRYDIRSSYEDELNMKINNALVTGKTNIYKTKDNSMILIEPYFPKPRLIIFGGGHIAKPLVNFGTKVGFSTTVVDDRPSFANLGRFPNANDVICDSFENSFNQFNIRDSDFIIIVTRGHRHDEVCLRNTLKYSPAYIGMIGSKRRVKGIKDKLLNDGYTDDQLDQVNAPIGLDIGAVTPEEIAISIIGEVISYRRINKTSDKTIKKVNWPEFEPDIINNLYKEDDVPKALVTIISSKGSVPRKAGAKMIVWLDGRTLGSIGGGCSEASIITNARDIILEKGYAIEEVDMTADMAEKEGMVCGGKMKVLIEAL